MIYDNVNNIDFYKGLSDDIFESLSFLKQANANYAIGEHWINPRVKVIVSEYETKINNEKCYEAHKRFIDIQYVLKGKERVFCLPIETMKEVKPYNCEKDAAFYLTEKQPQSMIIGEGYFAIFFPQDGHMPQLCVDEPQVVKKVVIKINIE